MRLKEKPLRRRVLRFIEKHGLIPPGKPLVVGVSGGPDSVCLLLILVESSEALGVSLHVAHLNHLLRGRESEADARYVSRLAQRLNLPLTLERRDVKAYGSGLHLSPEEAAREVRYGFFAEVAQATGASAVAVGHTADDQVETILMHLVRGTGLAGLRGMRPLSTLRPQIGGTTVTVVRPLLEVTREETEGYCASHRLSPRADSSNLSPLPLRNRVRRELLPLLQSYNPDIRGALLRLSRAAADDLSFLEREVPRLWGEVVKEEPQGLFFPTPALTTLPPSLERQLIRAMLQRYLGQEVESVHIEAIREALSKKGARRLSLPGGLEFQVDQGLSFLGEEGASLSPLPPLEGEHRLRIPGETRLPGWLVRAKIIEGPPSERGGGFKAYLDLAVPGKDLIVRGRRRGDRFQPLGMEKPKRLQDFMVDAKIPRSWRDRIPLVCSPHHILWVVGWRIDERAKVGERTEKVLSLELERI